MNDFQGKTAFITGAASGIGLALSQALAARGANVMMADIGAEAVADAAKALQETGGKVESVVCDVACLDQMRAAAEATTKAFGHIHILMNNAGVGLGGVTGQIDAKDWRWIIDINLMGVVHGVEVFTPLMLAHGEGGYIVNTASMAGHSTAAGLAPYCATKFAVVGYSECLQQELAPQGIDVSVLCPTWIKTNIHNTVEKRPTADGSVPASNPLAEMLKAAVENGMPPEEFAEITLDAMQKKRFYVFNDPEARAAVDTRHEKICEDYDAWLGELDKAKAVSKP